MIKIDHFCLFGHFWSPKMPQKCPKSAGKYTRRLVIFVTWTFSNPLKMASLRVVFGWGRKKGYRKVLRFALPAFSTPALSFCPPTPITCTVGLELGIYQDPLWHDQPQTTDPSPLEHGSEKYQNRPFFACTLADLFFAGPLQITDLNFQDPGKFPKIQVPNPEFRPRKSQKSINRLKADLPQN